MLELLRLNESDNQGIRFVILPRLLECGRNQEAAELLGRLQDDATANWAWARALITLRREGPTERAELHLQQARKANINVEDYLTGLEPIPPILPDRVGFGDETEAMVCAAEQIEAWRATPGAIEWIREIAELPELPYPAPDLEERRAFLFPPLDGELYGIDLADLDPADADERSILIAADHPELHDALDERRETVEVGGRVVNPRLHLAMHEVVGAQIWDGELDEVWDAAKRLASLGYERHEVLHMIASAVTDHVWASMHGRKAVDTDSYVRALERLPE